MVTGSLTIAGDQFPARGSQWWTLAFPTLTLTWDPAGGPDLAFLVLSNSPWVGLLLAAGRLLGTEALYGHRTTGLGAGRDLTQSSGLAAFL